LSGTRSNAEYYRSVARIGVQVADALAYAHKQGVLHRDIKPSNLLLDQQGTVWVTDFGLAKADGDDLTHTGDIVGTIRYMAPERFDGTSRPESDLYSLGLTLYEMIALRPAFDAANRAKLIEQVLREPPARLRRLDPGVPRDLETVILKCLAKDPKDRYATADELADDLRRFLADRSIRARRATNAEVAWRWCRRNPAIATLLAAVIVLLLTVSIGSSVAAVRMKRLAADEKTARHDAEIAADAERWERYRANLAAAAAALQMHNSAAARRALDAAPDAHRNWEWRHLFRQLHGARLTIAVPDGSVRTLALSPDARQFAAGGSGSDVYLYDAVTGTPGPVLRGHTARVTSLNYSRNGRRVAAGALDGSIRIWDPASGKELVRVRGDAGPTLWFSRDDLRIAAVPVLGGKSRLWDAGTGRELAILGESPPTDNPALGFSPDGTRLAVAAGEFVHLCDVQTGRRLAILGPHEQNVNHVAYSSNGKRIASSIHGAPFAVHPWDAHTGREVAVLRDNRANGTVAFSSDGSFLISGTMYPDNMVRVWDSDTGRLRHALAGHRNSIYSFAFSPDGKRIASASYDQTGRLWDAATGQLVAVLAGHTGRVTSVTFHPAGTHLVTASDDATLRLWDARTGELVAVLVGHTGPIGAPLFTPDGTRLLSRSLDGTVRVWDIPLLARNGILRGHESYVYDVAFCPDGEQVASAAWDGTVRLWNATTGEQTGLLRQEGNIVASVAYAQDGRRLVVGTRARSTCVWDVVEKKAIHSWATPMGDWQADARAVLNPAGTLIAMGSAAGPVRLWDPAAGHEVAVLEGHERGSTDAVFHPDGRRLATAGLDGTVRLWDLKTHAPIAVWPASSERPDRIIHRIAVSPDGRLLASGSGDRTVHLWDVDAGRLLAVLPVGSVVYAVAFNRDGTRLAAGCADNTIRLFDVATRQEVAELRGHTDYVHAVAWSPDGTRLVSGSGDFTVRVWDSLSVQERAGRGLGK
jgi:WD40 repeat protein